MNIKVCTKCGEDKTVENFYYVVGNKDHLHSWCKPCVNEYNKTSYKNNRDKRLETHNSWYKINREEILIRRNANYDPAKEREASLKRLYGITLEDYKKLFQEQKGVCAICKEYKVTNKSDKLYVDHNHTTGNVRGLLCHFCNQGLGNFEDNINLLQSSIDYLNKSDEFFEFIV